MLSLSENNQAEVIGVFNSTLGYLDDLLYIDNPYFKTNSRLDISH